MTSSICSDLKANNNNKIGVSCTDINLRVSQYIAKHLASTG